MSSVPTTDEIDAAVRTISSAMPHDPIDVWLPSYQTLRRAMHAIDRAYRPAAALQVGALAIGAIILFTATPDWNFMFVMATLIVFPALVGVVARFFTARAHPIVRRRRELEEATWPFNDRASLEFRASAP